MTDNNLILAMFLVPLLFLVVCYLLARFDQGDREALRREQTRVSERMANKVRYCLRRRLA